MKEDSLSMQAWYRDGVKVKLLSVGMMDLNCKGQMCDAPEMYANQIMAMSCPCFSSNYRATKLCVVFRLRMTFKDGKQITVDNFASKKFKALFMKRQEIPHGVIRSQF